jgi:hypothetical protein
MSIERPESIVRFNRPMLIHVDSELAARDLLNSRMAYVSDSRGAFDAQIFTNDRENLPGVLGHDVSKQTAQALRMNTGQAVAPQEGISNEPQQEQGMGLGIGL